MALLNKYLNDSGRPAQFRVDPNSDSKLIQEINPATGEVIGEYPAISFPALARVPWGSPAPSSTATPDVGMRLA